MKRDKLYEAIKKDVIESGKFVLIDIVNGYGIGVNKASFFTDCLVQDGVISEYSKEHGRKVLVGASAGNGA
jgi:DNA segregation ATPase FtsK/SpoIIIE-like protein